MELLHLVLAAIAGIVIIVLLITQVKLHPLLSLMVGSAGMAIFAGVAYDKSWDSFTAGLGATVANVGLLIVLGSMIGTLLVASGGADRIVDTIIAKTTSRSLPWAMALIAFCVGIPLFFEVGVVILIPVVIYTARRLRQPLMVIAIPALAGLSTLHAFVPPHPGPLAAISSVHANLGLTLGLGLLVAVPTVIVAGPLFAKLAARWVPVLAPEENENEQQRTDNDNKPSFAVSLFIILLPVILMMMSSIIDIAGAADSVVGRFLVFVGSPLTALFITTVVAMLLLGTARGVKRDELNKIVGSSLAPIASILLIVGAGGGFKQTLVDSGIADVLAHGITESAISPLFAGWLVAVLIRLATGSATVATVTAAGIMAPLVQTMDLSSPMVSLLVLAIGAGSVFFSHVNDAGFWLIKEYFHLSVGQTIKTWSIMETVLSVFGLAVVMLLSLAF